MSSSSLPELVRDFPQALRNGTAKALLSGGGPEKGKEPAWHPGVRMYLRVSGVLRNLARVCLWVFVICVVRVSDVCSVCVVCVFGVQCVCVYLVDDDNQGQPRGTARLMAAIGAHPGEGV